MLFLAYYTLLHRLRQSLNGAFCLFLALNFQFYEQERDKQCADKHRYELFDEFPNVQIQEGEGQKRKRTKDDPDARQPDERPPNSIFYAYGVLKLNGAVFNRQSDGGGQDTAGKFIHRFGGGEDGEQHGNARKNEQN